MTAVMAPWGASADLEAARVPLAEARRALQELRRAAPAARRSAAPSVVARLDRLYERAGVLVPADRREGARRAALEAVRAGLPRPSGGALPAAVLLARLEVLQGRAEAALRR